MGGPDLKLYYDETGRAYRKGFDKWRLPEYDKPTGADLPVVPDLTDELVKRAGVAARRRYGTGLNLSSSFLTGPLGVDGRG